MRVAAVDLGATSIRVAVVDLAADAPTVEVIHRWHHRPVAYTDGSVRWEWEILVRQIHLGLERASKCAQLASIAIDGWAVDYGLLDENGLLLSDPHSYRSPRTTGWRDIARSLGEADLYRRTGIQLMPINTIFQLAAHDREELRRARRLVMLPELAYHSLTGEAASEVSNAGTTGLYDVHADGWLADLADAVGVDPVILPDAEPAGRMLGTYRDVPVHLVATHDTACAFVASPLDPREHAFISTGTWFLVGMQRNHPDISDRARIANFSNERGAMGGYRFLKNVTGFWLLEECAKCWGTTAQELLEATTDERNWVVFDVADERLRAPEYMDEAVRQVALLPHGSSRRLIARSIIESIAAATASVIDELRTFQPVGRIAIVGGASRSALVRDRIAFHARADVLAGSTEAATLGNALQQGVALGRFRDLDEARSWACGSAAAAT